MACLTGLCVDYSPFRTLLPDLWLVCRDATTSLRSCNNFTGYLCDSTYCSRSLSSFSVFSRPSTVVLVRRLSACLWFPTAPSPVIWFMTCVVRRAHNKYGDRCFATAGPQVWNFLPAELQSCDSLRQFKRCLKTFLFGSWDYGALWHSVK